MRRRANLEPAKGKCVCGRALQDADFYVYRSHIDRYIFRICECGTESTEHRTDIDLTDPVSSDEIIEVHARLAKFDGPISELLEQRYA